MFENLGYTTPGPHQRGRQRRRGWGHVAAGIAIICAGVPAATWFLLAQEGSAAPILGVVAAGLTEIYMGRRMLARSAEEVRRDDPRPPVVFLRPFTLTAGELTNGDMFRRSYEQRLARAMRPIGPFIAIGSPFDEVPDLGAARVYVDDATWQAQVLEMLGECRLVIFHCGTSTGVMWELEQVLNRVPPDRVLLSLPTKEPRRKKIDVESYESFRNESCGLFPHPLPPAIPRGRFLYFDSDWRPSFLVISRKHPPRRLQPDPSEPMPTQSTAVHRLYNEFLPFWSVLRVSLAVGAVAALVLGLPGQAMEFGMRTSLFGLLPTEADVFEQHRADLDRRRQAFTAIAVKLPDPGSATPSPLAAGLDPPLSYRGLEDSNTDFLQVDQLLDPDRPTMDIMRNQKLPRIMQRRARASGDRATTSLREELAAALAIRYVLVHRMHEHNGPFVCEMEDGRPSAGAPPVHRFAIAPGLVAVEGFLVSLDTLNVVATYSVTVTSDLDIRVEGPTDPAGAREAMERVAWSAFVDKVRRTVAGAISDATHGAIAPAPDWTTLNLPSVSAGYRRADCLKAVAAVSERRGR